MEKEHKLADTNISRLLLKLALPATVGMLVTALYNIVDTIFIGQWVGSDGIAGLSIVFPIQLIVMGFGLMIGMGGASIISRALGAKDYDKANLTFGNQILSVLIFSSLIMLPGLIFPKEILTLFGAKDEFLSHSLDYYRIIVYGAPLFMFAMMSNNVLRAEGHAKVAMSNMLISAGLNIVFDPIFIYWLDMGVQGAALATVLAQGIVVFYLIFHFTKGHSSFRIRLKYLKLKLKILKETYAIGMAAFGRQVAGSLTVVIINKTLGNFDLGVIYIAVYGIINRLFSLFFMPIFGIGQGLQPVLGYNYGARRLDLAKKAIRLAFTWAISISTLAFIIIQIFPEHLMSPFVNKTHYNSSQVLEVGTFAMRRMTLLFPLIGFQVIGSTIFQALGRAGEALILSLSRQILFFIPIFYPMAHYFEFTGVLYTFPIADALAFVVTFIVVLRESKRWKKMEAKLPMVN